MAMTLVHDGPTMDWTMDNKIYDRYLIWKSDVELIFSSALLGASPLAEVFLPQIVDGQRSQATTSEMDFYKES